MEVEVEVGRERKIREVTHVQKGMGEGRGESPLHAHAHAHLVLVAECLRLQDVVLPGGRQLRLVPADQDGNLGVGVVFLSTKAKAKSQAKLSP